MVVKEDLELGWLLMDNLVRLDYILWQMVIHRVYHLFAIMEYIIVIPAPLVLGEQYHMFPEHHVLEQQHQQQRHL
jgi:hypothetical protein